MTRRNWQLAVRAGNAPAQHHRRVPLALGVWQRSQQMEIIDSITLVECNVRAKLGPTPRASTVMASVMSPRP